MNWTPVIILGAGLAINAIIVLALFWPGKSKCRTCGMKHKCAADEAACCANGEHEPRP